mmetsp:Transcript_2840/g.8499  ORF Transcript_2840/g.8499 Transcript_2840/m.8499 type:complete len:276 (-) Transcript_2840:1465-2292(-)
MVTLKTASGQMTNLFQIHERGVPTTFRKTFASNASPDLRNTTSSLTCLSGACSVSRGMAGQTRASVSGIGPNLVKGTCAFEQKVSHSTSRFTLVALTFTLFRCTRENMRPALASKIGLGVLGSCLRKCGLLTAPEIDAPLVVLATRASINFNVRAVWGPDSRKLGKRRWWRVVVDAMGIVLLPWGVFARPFCSAIVNLEVIEMPQCDATDIVVGDRLIHVAANNFGLVEQRPLVVSGVIAPFVDTAGASLRDHKRFSKSAVWESSADTGGVGSPR